MKYRRMGHSGVKVSEISLGSWLTYGGYVDDGSAERIIDKAYASGINFFDTANVYSGGLAEEIVGKALRKYPRSSYVLATKVWGKMGDGPNDRGLSRKHIMEQCDASLKRLNMDYIDLYYCHRFDEETPLEETLRALDDLVRQGKVLYIGVSNWTAAQITEAVGIADRRLLDRIVVNQPPYNMLNRSIEKELIPQCAKFGIGQVVYSPLAQGVLTGKYKSADEIPSGTRAEHAQQTNFFKTYLSEGHLQKIEQLKGVANELGLTLPQLALAWVLRTEHVVSAIIGASRPEQIDDNVKASGVELSADVLERIDSILNESN